MKCNICRNLYSNDELLVVLRCERLCNNCVNMFLYDKKNVKIEGVHIHISFFKHYKLILRDFSSHEFENVNHYIYVTSPIFHSFRKVIYYRREELNAILKKNCELQYKSIYLYEIL